MHKLLIDIVIERKTILCSASAVLAPASLLWGLATAHNTGYALRRCAPRPSAHWPSLRYGQRRIAWERYMKAAFDYSNQMLSSGRPARLAVSINN